MYSSLLAVSKRTFFAWRKNKGALPPGGAFFLFIQCGTCRARFFYKQYATNAAHPKRKSSSTLFYVPALLQPKQIRMTSRREKIKNHFCITLFIYEQPIAGTANMALAETLQGAFELMISPIFGQGNILRQLVDASIKQVHIKSAFLGESARSFILS